MIKKPKVSIIVTNFNNEKYIADCLKSATAQTYSEIEIVVIDDCSTDQSVSAIEPFLQGDPRIRLIVNEKNIGYLRSFNKALSECTGDLIAFIDGDDWITPQKIEKQVHAFAADPDLGCCGTGFARTDSSGRIYEVIQYPLTNEAIRQSLANNADACFCGSSVMVRREVIYKIGGYREFFIGSPAEDYDWLRRIANHFKVTNLVDPFYMYRFSPGSLSANVRDHEIPYFSAYIAMFLDRQRLMHAGRDGLDTPELEKSFQDFLSALAALYQELKGQVAFKKVVGLALRGTNYRLLPTLKSLWQASPLKAIIASFIYLMIRIIPISIILRGKRYVKRGKCNNPTVMALMDQYIDHPRLLQH